MHQGIDDLPEPGPTPNTLYHRTDAGERILASGFQDGEGSYGFATLRLKGVWVSDEPLTPNEGAFGEDLLIIDVPAGLDLRNYEVIESMPRGFREWCVPARVLNDTCTVKRAKDE
ncbi:MAG: hypothetical protein U1E29_02130 [Coriobacteriia bacterium]|nr:hypothetical protein [Coriobacteriia bacterium]